MKFLFIIVGMSSGASRKEDQQIQLGLFQDPWCNISKCNFPFCSQAVSSLIAVGTSHGLALIFGKFSKYFPYYIDIKYPFGFCIF